MQRPAAWQLREERRQFGWQNTRRFQFNAQLFANCRLDLRYQLFRMNEVMRQASCYVREVECHNGPDSVCHYHPEMSVKYSSGEHRSHSQQSTEGYHHHHSIAKKGAQSPDRNTEDDKNHVGTPDLPSEMRCGTRELDFPFVCYNY
jgi:hypothetical protein